MSFPGTHDPALCARILEATTNGLVATDGEGRIVSFNPEAVRILKLESGTALGAQLAELVPPLGRFIRHCLASGRGVVGQLLHAAGTDLLVNVAPLGADAAARGVEQEGASGVVCTFLELHIYENIAKRLDFYQQINRQMESIIDSSVDGIWIIDPKGMVLRMNKASEEIHGLKMADVVGLHVLELETRGLVDRVVSAEVLATGQPVTELTTVHGRQLLATGSPVFSDDGEILFVVVNERDMTELNALREQSEYSQMEAAKYKEELNKINMLELEQNDIVAESKPMLDVLQTAFKLAQLGVSNVLILGESGTGKGLLAKYIHSNSRRKDRPFIHINCAAIAENLLESELFGYEKGAFTGAQEQGKTGLIELAHEGTLFLDEIGDMPLQIQAKVLNYLDDGMVRRVGGTTSRRVDCSVLAATNRDLAAMVEEKTFRRDLFYRLNSFPITLMPLHERPEDIGPLVLHYIEDFNKEFQLNRRISASGLLRLQGRRYRGNVRELRNLIKRAMVLSDEDTIDAALFLDESAPAPSEGRGVVTFGEGGGLREQLDAVEKALLAEAVRQHRSTRQIAAALGIDHSTVVRKLKKHDLQASGAAAHRGH